jgi:hypothetical protein
MIKPANIDEQGTALKNHKVYLLALIILVGFAISVFFHYFYGQYLSLGYPFNTFLFKPSDRFVDYYSLYKNISMHSIYVSGFITNYFPFSYITVFLLTFVPPQIAMLATSAVFMGTLCYIVYRHFIDSMEDKALKTLLLFVFAFLSYPVLFALDRANVELALFMFLALFFYFYYARKSNLGIVFLAMAIAMKLYPAVLLVLLISDKKMREAIFTAFLALGLTFASYIWASWLIGRGLLETFSLSLQHLSIGSKLYAFVGLGGIQHGHSLWGTVAVLKILGFISDLTSLILPYTAFVGLLFLLVSCYIIFVEKTPWKKVALLIFMMILLPYTSNDYTLIHVFFPLALFVNTRPSKYDAFYIVFFGILLIPMDYFWLNYDVSISVIVYPLVIMILMTAIIKEGLSSAIGRRKTGKLSTVS